MSAKINLYNGLVTVPYAAVEPKEGYVYIVTKIMFRSETDSIGNVSAGSPGHDNLVSTTLQPRRETGWDGTEVVKYGESLIVAASPAGGIRCVVEGYFLLDVPAFARVGAGSMDSAYAADGAIHTQDSLLARTTYLMLVEPKRIRMALENSGADASLAAEEANRELES